MKAAVFLTVLCGNLGAAYLLKDNLTIFFAVFIMVTAHSIARDL